MFWGEDIPLTVWWPDKPAPCSTWGISRNPLGWSHLSPGAKDESAQGGMAASQLFPFSFKAQTIRLFPQLNIHIPFCFYVTETPLKNQQENQITHGRLFGLRKRCPQHRLNCFPGFTGLSLVFNKDCCSDTKEKHLLPCVWPALTAFIFPFLREQFGLIKTQAKYFILWYIPSLLKPYLKSLKKPQTNVQKKPQHTKWKSGGHVKAQRLQSSTFKAEDWI